MITNIDGKEYVTDWAYQWTSQALENGEIVDTVATTCLVSPRIPGKKNMDLPCIGAGRAFQNPGDNHCKKTARKLTLERALKAVKIDGNSLTREQRGAFWQSYLNR